MQKIRMLHKNQRLDKVLQNLGVSDNIPILEIWNKIDLVEPDKRKSLQNIAKRRKGICTLSATTSEGISTLVKNIKNELEPQKFSETLIVPFEYGDRKAWLHENGVVVNEFYTDAGFKFDVTWSDQQRAKYYSFAG